MTITVTAVNDAPTAVDDAYATDEDTPLVVPAPGPLGNDTDPDGDVLTAALVTGPTNGTLTGTSTAGAFTYTPNPDFAGTDTFTYTVTDGELTSNVATVTITVTSTDNDAPTAVNDAYATTEDTPLVIAAPGVLGNDTDPDPGTTLTPALVTDPANGTLTGNLDGSFTYTPNANFAGIDTFTYTVSDGALTSNVATVTIIVTSTDNDAPTAGDDTISVVEDSVANVVPVLANDTDPDPGTILTITAVTPGTNGGTATIIGSGRTGLTYTPAANFVGTDTFTYTISDGAGGTDTATVTVTVTAVNDAPVALDDAYTTDEDTPLVIAAPGPLGNDTDPDGDALTPALLSTTTNGTLAPNLDGSFTYTPNADFAGTDSFTYSVTDPAGLTDTATVTITVTAVNDAPTAVDDAYATDEDTPLVVPAPGPLGNDTDPDGDVLTAALVTGPTNGTLTGTSTAGAFTYTPNPDFAGTDTFTYTVTDGELTSNVATVTITVTSTDNDAPTAVNDAYATTEDTPLVIAAPGVLGNDTDPDPGTTLTPALVTDPANGTLTGNLDGSFTYTPNANFAGIDTFTYTVSDGALTSNVATVTIIVTSTDNDAPTAGDDTISVVEDSVANVVPVLANDTDPDPGTILTITAVTPGTNGGTATIIGSGRTGLTYTPAANFVGTDTFTYTISDGAGGTDTATVTVTVTAVNDAPVALDDAYTTDEDTPLVIAAPGPLGNDTDPDGDALTPALLSTTTNGTLAPNLDGSFTYTPNADFAGTDSFTYSVTDPAGLTDTATVTITVTAVNDAPTAVDDAYATDEDTPLVVPAPGPLGNDTDPDGDVLTAALVTGPTNGTLTGTSTAGAFTYTPNPDFAGTDTFTYTVTDGELTSNVATVTITVTSTDNDAPTAVNDAYATTEDTPLVIAAPGVLGNDTDPDPGTTLTPALVTDPANGTLTGNLDGSFTYTPNANFAGIDTFTYTVSDGALTSNVATVTIIVTSTDNDAPTAGDDTISVVEDSVANVVPVLANDTDPDPGTILTITAVTPGTNGGTATIIGSGRTGLTYTPAANFVGTDTFTYTISDGAGGTDTATVTVTVTESPTNDLPTAGDDVATVVEDSVDNVIPVLGNDSDPDALNVLTITAVTAGTNGGVATITGGGTGLTYTPAGNFVGTDVFTYTISDGAGGSDTATVTITVTASPVNDPPVAVDDALHRRRGRRPDRAGGHRCAGQRLRPRRRHHPDRVPGHRRHQRHPGPDRRRLLRLHPRHQLRRHRHLHLHRRRRHRQQRRHDRDDHRHRQPGQRSPGRRRRRLHRRRRRRPDRAGGHRCAGQRLRPRRRHHPDRVPGHRRHQRHPGPGRRRLLRLHPRHQLRRHRHLHLHRRRRHRQQRHRDRDDHRHRQPGQRSPGRRRRRATPSSRTPS